MQRGAGADAGAARAPVYFAVFEDCDVAAVVGRVVGGAGEDYAEEGAEVVFDRVLDGGLGDDGFFYVLSIVDEAVVALGIEI